MTILDDPGTPARLRGLRDAMRNAKNVEDRGALHTLERELSKISSLLCAEVRSLNGSADPELLIALWSTAQLGHVEGVEYANTDARPSPEPEVVF
jgi:hypothetical protein